MTEFTRIDMLKAKLQPLDIFLSQCDPLEYSNPLDFDFSSSKNMLYHCGSAPLAHIMSENLQNSGVTPQDDVNDDLQDQLSCKISRKSTEKLCDSTRHESCASIFESLYELSPAKQRTFQSVLGKIDQAKQVESNLYELEPETNLMEQRQRQSQNHTDKLCQQRFTFVGACAANELSFTNPCSQLMKEKIDAQHMENETTFGVISTEFNTSQRRNSIVQNEKQEPAMDQDDHLMQEEKANDSAQIRELIEPVQSAQPQSSSGDEHQELSAPDNLEPCQTLDEQHIESPSSEAEIPQKIFDSQPQESNKIITRQFKNKGAKKEKNLVLTLQRKSLRIKKDSKKATASKSKVELLSTSEKNETGFKCKHCDRIFESPQGLGGHMSKAHEGLSESYLRAMTVRDHYAPRRKAKQQAMLLVLTIMKENGELDGRLQSYLEDVESGKAVKSPAIGQFPHKYAKQIKTIMGAMI